ncbi:DoxX family protein [Streptomyces millisiae]|uniref:DoxX family protein n=1 Tax=Streptomyces millisiae TaxID=3075542 RepID=A0ABU2LK50_9ACTN|nr:DoxX family protein [Streptomyces sp. DSM 44918]MDT0317964.1 DoxX family protein [Streptomyces sp. DSM 44918]
MAPFVFLVGGFAVLRLLGLVGVDALDAWQPALRGGLALMFLATGLAHFVRPKRDELIAMVPPALPRPRLLVDLTGVLELVGAAGLLIPPVAPYAALALALLMLAMTPANVSAARRRLPGVTPLPTRMALQVVFVGAAVAAAL